MASDKNLISTYAAAVLSIICKKIPKLLDYIIKQSSTPKDYEKLLAVPFTLLTTEQVKDALDSDEGLLRETLSLLSNIQGSLNLAYLQMETIEEQKERVGQTIVSLIELMSESEEQNEGGEEGNEYGYEEDYGEDT